MRTGVLTGGGDCSGLNAVIRAVVREGVEGYGHNGRLPHYRLAWTRSIAANSSAVTTRAFGPGHTILM
jgi:hypothetical protein